MPEKRRHRGPHPEDARLFAPDQWEKLRAATADLSWLLTRGYAAPSALKLVGDHYSLDKRQRTAVMRSACSDQALERRRAHQVGTEAVRGQRLLLDGYNVLTSVEAALAGGVLIRGRDGALRDMASMHGSFRKVQETPLAVEKLGQALMELEVPEAIWYLDSPVSNSGRLKVLIRDLASRQGWRWQVELVENPDRILLNSQEIVASADSVILDGCRAWFDLASYVVERLPGPCKWIDLGLAS